MEEADDREVGSRAAARPLGERLKDGRIFVTQRGVLQEPAHLVNEQQQALAGGLPHGCSRGLKERDNLLDIEWIVPRQQCSSLCRGFCDFRRASAAFPDDDAQQFACKADPPAADDGRPPRRDRHRAAGRCREKLRGWSFSVLPAELSEEHGERGFSGAIRADNAERALCRGGGQPSANADGRIAH